MTEMCMKYALSQVYDSLHIYMHTSDTHVTALYMQLMRACKCAVIRLFVNWAVRPMTGVCMKMCSEQLSYSLHIYTHTSVTRVTAHFHALCKCAVNRLSDVFDNCAVSPMTDVCMKMCSEPIA